MPKKKSKKELAKEAEEARKRLEEEQLQRELGLKREREELEKKQRKELDAIFKQQAERLDDELKQVQTMKAMLGERWRALEQHKREKINWQRFLECDQLPDPSSEREINTYMSMLREEVKCDYQSMDLLMEKLEEMDKLSILLQNEVSQAQDGDLPKRAAHVELCRKLRTLINEKWDELSSDILQNQESIPGSTEDEDNFKTIMQAAGFKVGVWSNSTHNPRFKSIDFPALKLSSSIPKPLSLESVSMRMMQQFSLPVVHLFDKCQEHRPVGSVLFLDLVETPAPVVKSKNWLIKSRIEPMRQLEYPFAKNGDEVIEDDQDAVSLAMQWPASVQFELPPGLLVQAEAATVMWWDASVERWSSAGIEEVDLSLSSNQVKFRTTHFAPTALVQNAYAEYPLTKWSLSYTGQNRATLSLTGKYTSLVIHIADSECQLIRPLEQLEEDKFKDQWMSPSQLFQMLSFAGVNFHGPDSSSTTVKGKAHEIAEQVALGVAFTLGVYNFERSNWNTQLDADKAALRFAPAAKSDAAPEALDATAWTELVLDNKFETLSAKYAMNYTLSKVEQVEEIKLLPENKANGSAYNTLKEFADTHGLDMHQDDVSPQFRQTIYNIMRMVKPCGL